MFWDKKKKLNRHIIAVKDFENSLEAMKAGNFYLPYEKEIYLELLETDAIKVDKLRELNNFIKKSNKDKHDVIHSWERFISNGYTLINVHYDAKAPSIQQLCSNNSIKYVANVTFK